MKEQLLKVRYMVIATYPSQNFLQGTILYPPIRHPMVVGSKKDQTMASDLDEYPHLFKKLKWWENRSIDEMLQIKYIKVVQYEGYWREGDIVPVTDYDIDKINRRVTNFISEYNHRANPDKCEPASKEDYEEFKRKK